MVFPAPRKPEIRSTCVRQAVLASAGSVLILAVSPRLLHHRLRHPEVQGGRVFAAAGQDEAAVLSPAAKKCGFKDKGYICYEEDAQESVVLRELVDKKLWNIPDRIKDKEQFEEKLNQSIRQYHPEYWRARQSGREAVEAARSTAPAKEAAR